MLKINHIIKKVNQDYRLIAISDIHSHLDRFKSLLERVHYQKGDYLVIVGDFVEKGTQTLQTIRYLKQLQQESNRVFVLLGNCEYAIETLINDQRYASQMMHYVSHIGKSGMIDQALTALKLDRKADPHYLQKQVQTYLKPYLDYLHTLPLSLHFNEFLFIHAGIEKRTDWYNGSLSSMIETKTFYQDGHCLNDYVVVGHLPTSNQYQNKIDNHIIINNEKRIICLDGGTGVKMISQMNALVVESKNHKSTLKKEYVQPFPIYEVTHSVSINSKHVHKIAWPHFEVEILKQGQEFSLCKQIDTQAIFPIKNEFLYYKNNKSYCLDDYIDCFLSVNKGNKIKIAGIYGNYAYGICHNDVGWIPFEYIKK